VYYYYVAPERAAIQSLDGVILEERVDPRSSFPPASDSVRWDAIQVAYFTSAAVWNYLTAPFVLARPDVEASEIEPWNEDGQVWRRLVVRFPPTIANHNPDQVFYFDDGFMLRRLDYSPGVTGKPPIAHYTHEPKTFDGFVFPTKRRVHVHNAKGIANQAITPITLDVHGVSIERV
jgi:hypothetical protein